MNRYYSLEFNTDAIPSNDSIHCHTYGCRTQVACFNDYFPMSRLGELGLFDRVFNVHVPDNASYHQPEIGTTVAKAYCCQCRKMIGWKIIGVPGQHTYVREGRFCMKLDKLTFSNHIPLLRSIEEQIERNADQDADAAGQDLGVNEKNDGDANEQEVGANQDGGSNDQDGGAPMN
ncbi:uncharacterized protein LOC125872382 [Solanum stenotomum]|uniref:uncharacterized protein LOC125872382 n=1 Tax=Solanum stenotomum TaxID=172797 RepID=UPI0020D04910|nr:uncharacterized protein LOC125872382 [Solanum stenotomum]